MVEEVAALITAAARSRTSHRIARSHVIGFAGGQYRIAAIERDGLADPHPGELGRANGPPRQVRKIPRGPLQPFAVATVDQYSHRMTRRVRPRGHLRLL